PGAVPALEGVVDLRVPTRQLGAQVTGLVGLARFDNGSDAGIFREKMWRNQSEAANAVILMAAGINRRNGRAIAVANQQATLKADGVEQPRQGLARLVVHVRKRARQRDR